MIRQRLVATSCSGVAVVVVGVSALRRRLSAARLLILLALACASLASGVVLVFRDSRQWDAASVALTGLAVVLVVAAAWCLVAAARPRVAADWATPGR
jgi:uncharacterized membrane protein HdeD (DUF308 family)